MMRDYWPIKVGRWFAISVCAILGIAWVISLTTKLTYSNQFENKHSISDWRSEERLSFTLQNGSMFVCHNALLDEPAPCEAARAYPSFAERIGFTFPNVVEYSDGFSHEAAFPLWVLTAPSIAAFIAISFIARCPRNVRKPDEQTNLGLLRVVAQSSRETFRIAAILLLTSGAFVSGVALLIGHLSQDPYVIWDIENLSVYLDDQFAGLTIELGDDLEDSVEIWVQGSVLRLYSRIRHRGPATDSWRQYRLGDFSYTSSVDVSTNAVTMIDTPTQITSIDRLNTRYTWASLSLWWMMSLLGAYPIFVLFRGPVRRWRWARRGRCIGCGYDLTGAVSDFCTECGAARPAE